VEPPVDAGNSTSGPITVTIPPGFSGSFILTVVADADNQVAELSKANNNQTRTPVVALSPAGAGPADSGESPLATLGSCGQLPLSFVANGGHVEAEAAVFIAPTSAPAAQEVATRLRALPGSPPEAVPRSGAGVSSVVRMRLLGANAPSPMTGGEQTVLVNYPLASDFAKWRTGVPAYARVRAHLARPVPATLRARVTASGGTPTIESSAFGARLEIALPLARPAV
jgi:hypothetical protein